MIKFENTEICNNVKIYGLEESIKASKYPMSVNIDNLNNEITNTVKKLAQCEKGTGHDNFLNGIIVQFDLTFTNKAWTEMERYHFIDFVSSQSTMHCITKFDLDKAYIEYVDPKIVEIMKEKIKKYNEWDLGLQPQSVQIQQEREKQKKKMYLEILYSNPCGFKLTARMTTNYRQLKTIYSQRKNHRLPEWKKFCRWIKTLPYANELIVAEENNLEE